ncbi:GRP family sugar transporter [Schaalia sp. ZJ405]|uniref:GRP family sugar transporter n=1 Tax=Schaalia sp. ZJ405 TaxID=2709403 RepID=UPI0013EBD71D|nr:GRP family sugar transporter [Schaalia sp. ZJ405]
MSATAPTALDYFLAVLPSILFGLQTTFIGKIQASDRQRILGVVSGGLLTAAAITPFLHVNWNLRDVAVALISGLFLGWGLCEQLTCFAVLGVSRTIPITTGGQLGLMSLAGILLFGEWRNGLSLPVGVLSIILLSAGIWLVSRTEAGSQASDLDWGRGTRLLITSTIGLVAYVLIGRWFGVEGAAILLPQAIGYTSYCFGYFGLHALRSPVGSTAREPLKIRNFNTLTLMSVGIIWCIAVVLLQVGSARVGVASGFTLTQLGILISTPLGIWWLGETRTKRELLWTAGGVVCVLIGAVLAGVAKGIDAAG